MIVSDTLSIKTTMLWICMGVDKTTGQFRPPVPNIQSRLTSAKDIRSTSAAATQVVNNVVTVHTGPTSRHSTSSDSPSTRKNTPLMNENIKKKQPENMDYEPASMEMDRAMPHITATNIPLRTTDVRAILRQWLVAEKKR